MTNGCERERSYVLDGRTFSDFAGFCAEFNRVVLAAHDATWCGNLDAFNDFLCWPEEEGGWVLTWKNSAYSRIALGHEAMARKLARTLETCHPSNRGDIAKQAEEAKRGEGPTLFDALVGIILGNGEYVELRLE